MAGHSKWANIKFKKAAADAKRGKLFTKLVRAVTVAAREGGADPDSNPALRTAIDKAYAGNMTKDAVERAIKKGAGGNDGENMENVRYEGYGPHGVAVMVDCLTDNRNRTVSDVRHAFTKHGGNLGTNGSVSYLFNQVGQIILAIGTDEDKALEIALESGATDVELQEDKSISIETSAENFDSVKQELKKAGFEIVFAELAMVASTEVALDKEQSHSILKLIDWLEELDDVQEVATNADIAQEVMEQM